MVKSAAYSELQIVPGVMPHTDATASDVPCWTWAYHVRFDPNTGRIRKLGGWESQTFDYDRTISGTVRTIYSVTINGKVYTLLGSNSYLYSLIGSRLTNITPLKASSVAAANSLATHYGTLANNPISTTSGSNTLIISDTSANRYQVNDNYTLSGATATNGVPNTNINTTHVIRGIDTVNNTISVIVPTAATGTGSGGGNAVVRSDGLIRVTSAAHGMSNGQRVKISGAASTGGILNAQINLEFIIRNVAANTFDVMTAGTSTSAVSGGGGASTVYFAQIDAGAVDQGLGQGYGAGYFGVGLYGTALTSVAGETYPRIWFMDRFGDNILMTPGNQGGAYAWAGNGAVAPALITNAPGAINYLFVSDNILVTFGAGGVENKIFSSDQGNYTIWTASSTNQVFEDNVEGAGRLISHVPVDGYNLIFTEQQTYTFNYIGLPAIWQIQLLDSAIGIIAPMARVAVNGIAYWMGQENFYMFRGGKIEIIPSNFGSQSSILRYVFDNLNYGQRSKIFAWYNEEWDEIWWHYPSSDSNECDRIARFSRRLSCWVPDELDRTAAEYPAQNLSNPRLANVDVLYIHESGANDDDTAMAWSARTKKYVTGKDTEIISAFIPDSMMSGEIGLTLNSYNYPQSQAAMNSNQYAVTGTSERISAQVNGRYYDLTLEGAELDQTFLMGRWFVETQKGATAP